MLLGCSLGPEIFLGGGKPSISWVNAVFLVKSIIQPPQTPGVIERPCTRQLVLHQALSFKQLRDSRREALIVREEVENRFGHSATARAVARWLDAKGKRKLQRTTHAHTRRLTVNEAATRDLNAPGRVRSMRRIPPEDQVLMMNMPRAYDFGGAFEVLGRGAFGRVIKATWNGQPVAVKMLGVEVKESIYQRELAACKRLIALPHCPAGLVRFLDYGTTSSFDGTPVGYFTMEYIAGQTLTTCIGDLTEQERDWVAYQLCAAVYALHANWIIHRDLKPANILWVKGRGCRIVDLGIAKTLAPGETVITVEEVEHRPLYTGIGPATTAGCMLGTPAYAPLEQMTPGGRVGMYSDIAALGRVLIELFEGRIIFGRRESPDIRKHHRCWELGIDWNSMHGIQAADPSGKLIELLKAMTQPDPAERRTAHRAASFFCRRFQERWQS